MAEQKPFSTSVHQEDEGQGGSHAQIGAKGNTEHEAARWLECQRLRSMRLLRRDATHGICGACRRIRDHDAFSHHDHGDLVDSARRGCAPCGVLLTAVNGYPGSLPALGESISLEAVVDRPNERLWVYIQGASWSVGFDFFVLNYHDDTSPPRTTTEDGISAETNPGNEAVIAEAEEVFFFPTLHRKIPPDIDTLRSYQGIHHWLNNCLRNHPRCKDNAGVANPARVYPTRLLEIYKDSVRLQPQSAALPTRPPYAALSYCWGVDHTLTTTSANLAAHTSGIPRGALPQTIQDAVSVCFRLGIRFIWVDALCVLQDSPQDWTAECRRMGDYYSSAILTISALDAYNVNEGFLHSRSVLPSARLFRSVWDPQGYGGHPEIWIRQSPQSQGMVMQKAPLSRRGWALQERVLSTRIVHFARTELIWECLTCSAREGSTEIHEQKQDCSNLIYSDGTDFKRVLFIPNQGNHFSTVDGAFAVWHRFVMEYSGRDLTQPGDRLPAIAGLAAVIGEKTGSQYCAGVFAEDLAQLAWGKERTTGPDPTPAPVPSWSWARPNSRVKFPFYDQERTGSPLDAIFLGFDEGIIHGCLTVRAQFVKLGPLDGSARIRIVERVQKTKAHMIPGLHRLRGCSCRMEVEERLVYYLDIAPEGIEPGHWRRVGMGVQRYVAGCTGKQDGDHFHNAKWETVRLV